MNCEESLVPGPLAFLQIVLADLSFMEYQEEALALEVKVLEHERA